MGLDYRVARNTYFEPIRALLKLKGFTNFDTECRVLSWNSCAAVVCNQHTFDPISINSEQLAADTQHNLYDICSVQDHYGKWWDADKKVEMHTVGQLNERDIKDGTQLCDQESPAPRLDECKGAIHKVLNYDTTCYGLAPNTCHTETEGECFAKVCNLIEGPATCMDTDKILAQFQVNVWTPCIKNGFYGMFRDDNVEIGLVWQNSSWAAAQPDNVPRLEDSTDGKDKVEASMGTIGQLGARQIPEVNGTTNCDSGSEISDYANCIQAMSQILDFDTDTPCFGLAQNTCSTVTVGDCFAKVCNLREGPAVCMNTDEIKGGFLDNILMTCMFKRHYGWWSTADMELAIVPTNSSMAIDQPDRPTI